MANDQAHELVNGMISQNMKKQSFEGINKAACSIGLLVKCKGSMQRNSKGKNAYLFHWESFTWPIIHYAIYCVINFRPLFNPSLSSIKEVVVSILYTLLIVTKNRLDNTNKQLVTHTAFK